MGNEVVFQPSLRHEPILEFDVSAEDGYVIFDKVGFDLTDDVFEIWQVVSISAVSQVQAERLEELLVR